MAIQRLADYVVNKLKAGEVVERPYSVIKELVENSLDAGATTIHITVVDGGMSRIVVEDNGSGIQVADMDMVLERYATSKIQNDEDLMSLASYGFRGEALASIAEVSKMTITSKTAYSQTAIQLYKDSDQLLTKPVSVGFEHGTQVIVQDLFYNVPARLKFLKSSQTEYYYCYNYFLDIALVRHDVAFVFKKNDTVIFDVAATDDIPRRIKDLFKKDRQSNLRPIHYTGDHMQFAGMVGDAMLRFGSQDNMRIYVNKRPVQDRIIKKAIMDVYRRQITPGEYPFITLFLDIKPSMVDVNVHPRKLEVKFVDSQDVFQTVVHVLSDTLADVKIARASVDVFGAKNLAPTQSSAPEQQSMFRPDMPSGRISSHDIAMDAVQESLSADAIGEYIVLGQLWNMYIVLQDQEALYYIDQHALAERIAFEKLKNYAQEAGLQPQALLQAIRVSVPQVAQLDEKIAQLQALGFDIAALGENSLAVYAVPEVFVRSVVDLEQLMEHVLYLDKISFDIILDEIYAMKACKASIKAGEKLSHLQMLQLVKDGFEHIEGMFVCQHGRPFFIRMAKKDIDKLMDR